MGPAHRREHVKHVLEAKQADTRARRITAAVAAFEQHAETLAAKAMVARPRSKKR
jgi:hypothetical protein